MAMLMSSISHRSGSGNECSFSDSIDDLTDRLPKLRLHGLVHGVASEAVPIVDITLREPIVRLDSAVLVTVCSTGAKGVSRKLEEAP